MIHSFRALQGVFGAFLLGLMISACTNKDKVPSDVIPMAEMEQVIYDMIKADRFANQFIIRDTAKNVKTETFKLYDQVFQLHKIDREEFIHSYKFYLGRPDISKVMFDSLASRANKERADIYRADSIVQAKKNAVAGDTLHKATDSLGKITDSVNKAKMIDSLRKNAALKQGFPPSAPIFRIDSLRKDSLRKKLTPFKKELFLKRRDSLLRKNRKFLQAPLNVQ